MARSDAADPAVLAENLTACLRELQETLNAARNPPSSAYDFQDGAISIAADSPEGLAAATPASPEFDRQSQSGPYSHTPSTSESAGAEDAATILEFLAWGRRKVSTYETDLIDPGAKSTPTRVLGDVALDQDPTPDPVAPQLQLSDESPLSLLQMLLPPKQSTVAMVKYHCECLLWYHASFHALVFEKELDMFMANHEGRIDHPEIDLQWAALLFAVLTASMTCAPALIASSWGFQDQERALMAQRWFKAALICLNRANYTANHTIYAVQCITTMTMSAHILGHSNSHSVMLATAVRISQSLGFHRLGSPSEDHPANTVRREIGRRVWSELCIQDWFSIPFSESCLIRQLDFNTDKPRNCMDEDMISLPDNVPTITSYHRFLYDVALLMPQMHDDLSRSNTVYTKYEHVLRYDTRMRTLASKHVPPCLKSAALEPGWPQYVPWARHCLTISSAHKIIMVHRKFLWQSFTNPAFSVTRKTCIAASKTIIRAQKEAAIDDGPELWIYHAFSVAAGIILCLDLRFRSPSEPEYRQHRSLIHNTISILSQSEISMIAKRGVRILRLLLQLEHDRIQNQPPHTRAEELMSERSSTMASNSNPNQYGVHSRMSENAERLAVDVHRLVVQAFYEQEVASHRRPQKGTGQRQESEFTLSPTLHGPNHWPWPVPAQEDFDFGEEHSTRSPTQSKLMLEIGSQRTSSRSPVASSSTGGQVASPNQRKNEELIIIHDYAPTLADDATVFQNVDNVPTSVALQPGDLELANLFDVTSPSLLDLNGWQESGQASQDFNFDEQLISWTEDNNCLLQPWKPTQPSLSWEGVKDIVAPENGWLDLPPEIPSLASTLCDFFFKEVIRKYCAWDSKVNKMRVLMGSLWQHSGPLYHIIQSMSASCLAENFPHLTSVAVHERKQAVELLRLGSVRDSKVKEDRLLATYLLGHTASWHDPGNLALDQFQASRDLVHKWATQGANSETCSETIAFFEEGLDYWAMLVSFIGENANSRDLPSFTSTVEPKDRCFLPHPWSGISRQTTRTLTEIGLLVANYRKRFSKIKFLTERDIDVFRAALTDARSLESRLLTTRQITSSDIQNTGDNQTTTVHLGKMEEAYRYTGLLQLYRVFPDLLADRYRPWDESNIVNIETPLKVPSPAERDEWLTKFALHIINMLSQIPFESGTRSIQPFIMVATSSELRCVPTAIEGSVSDFINATFIEVAQARQFVRARLSAYSHILPLRKVAKIIELIDRIWTALDGDQPEAYWIEIAHKEDLFTIMG
ncbi:Protein of unknown function DUF3468 [Penicillium occitanis (nom. inval.)]|nr:hypothetical protein PENOC_037080 [Penicillium occitanis (nom. inval.)]PCH06861.1 Protein of unknown function DUF3468 [Penicillium occitanis (nom. inval.)]